MSAPIPPRLPALLVALALAACVEPFPDVRNALTPVDQGIRDALADPPDGPPIDLAIVDAGPALEICNGRDDDGDGQTDEEVPIIDCPLQQGVCANARQPCLGAAGYGNCTYAEAEPPFEREEQRCDDADNDCDGQVDEGCDCMPGDSRICGSDIGACTTGRQLCGPDGRYAACQGATPPREETCDGVDEDCDGRLDEVPGLECDTGQAGRCAKGRRACVDGADACEAVEGPGVEVCNGVDDDCDAVVDEQTAGGGCATNRPGICAVGRLICAQGGPRCTETVRPTAELPNDGLDNDCDGSTDEREPPRFDLADVAVGGVGVLPGQPPQLIPLDGILQSGGFQVSGVPFLNGAFSPSPVGLTPIDADGTTFDFSPEVVDAHVGQPLAKGPMPAWEGRPNLPDYGMPGHSIIELRPNTGLTFDVGEIGATHGAVPRRLTLRFGNLLDQRVVGMVLIDGARRISSPIPLGDELAVDLQLNPQVRRISIVLIGPAFGDFDAQRTYVGDATVHMVPD